MDRRNAIKTMALAGAAAALPRFSGAVGNNSKTRVGLIGCSGRGLSAVGDMLAAANGSVQIVAIADLFPDRLDVAMKLLKGTKRNSAKNALTYRLRAAFQDGMHTNSFWRRMSML